MTVSVSPGEQPIESKLRSGDATVSGSMAFPLECRAAAPQERSRALALLYRHRSPQCREALFRWARRLVHAAPQAFAGLFVAVRQEELHGVVWGFPVPGRQVNIWLPILASEEPAATQGNLLAALDGHLQHSRISLAYATPKSDDEVSVLTSNGFCYAADMARMQCVLSSAHARHARSDVEMLAYRAVDAERLKGIVQRTYENSLDCPAMRGARHVDDVLEGHLNRGELDPSHWRIVRWRGRDVGCLLVSRHRSREECEVVYLGLAPEARGMGLGRDVIRHAQQLARSAGAEKLMLGCDVNNPPALRTYVRAGFREIDRWPVFAKTYGTVRS